VKDGHRVFLSGTNLAWIHYAYDFGNNQYNGVRTQFEQVLRDIHNSGGNSIRKLYDISYKQWHNFGKYIEIHSIALKLDVTVLNLILFSINSGSA